MPGGEWSVVRANAAESEGESLPLLAHLSDKDQRMAEITFKRMSPHESRIMLDGEYVADVYRQTDIVDRGKHFYVAHLGEDVRGPVRIHDRWRIREPVERMVRSHPLW